MNTNSSLNDDQTGPAEETQVVLRSAGPLPRALPHSAVASEAIFYGAVGSIRTADRKRPDKVTKKASRCPAVPVQLVGDRKGDDSSAE